MKKLISLAVALAAPLSAQASLANDVNRANVEFISAWRNRDYAGMAAHYETNGRYISRDGVVNGRENIERLFAARTSALVLLEGRCTTHFLERDGLTATELGECRYTVRRGSEIQTQSGRYITVWAYDPSIRHWLIRLNVVP